MLESQLFEGEEVAPGEDRVAVDEAQSQSAVGELKGADEGHRGQGCVEGALDMEDLGRYGPEVLQEMPSTVAQGTQVPCHQDLLDLARDEEPLELEREVGGPKRDMDLAKDQNQHLYVLFSLYMVFCLNREINKRYILQVFIPFSVRRGLLRS